MPTGLNIITSNRLEVLVAGLAGILATPPQDPGAHPLQPEQVMVQSKGMQRWISMAVARINGICANVAFPFPNALLETLYARLVGPLPAANPFDARLLAFRILRLLPELLPQPAFDPLRRYLADDDRPLKRYQLARKIADVLDQYAVFRPDLLIAWEADGQGGASPEAQTADAVAAKWQAVLWHRLATDHPGMHRSAMQQRLIQTLNDAPEGALEGLPPRLAVFGISYLPPFHLAVLEALARHRPVVLFSMNPCRHYWSDILSDHQQIRRRTAAGRSTSTASGKPPKALQAEDLHLDSGNRLLASLGQLGKPFFDFIQQSTAHMEEAFQDGPATLLGTLQQDILDLVDRGPAADDPAAGQRPVIAENDRSLQIHSCHGPMREVEVLYDQLLDLLAADPTLEPRDILVMTPNIGLYAPYIHAVFGALRTSGDPARLPYTVTDQRLPAESATVETFLSLLDLKESRFEASRVMALLECPAVHQRFGLCNTDLVLVEKWMRAADIRWGWDRRDRRRHRLPAFRENTWRTGLDRLVLGYALDGAPNLLFADVLPLESIGAGEEQVLGGFVHFAETLRDTVVDLPARDTLAGWHRRMHQMIETFFHADAMEEGELAGMLGAVAPLAQGAYCGEAAFAFEVVRQYIRDALGATTRGVGFMAGGITFCAMLPMRSIPADAICLLGLNHDAFPRQEREPGFNLISLAPRRGDRSKRMDDRYLFLETLISARRTLYISYVGQDIQDNTPIPPSVVVDDLVEYVQEGFGIPPEQLVTRHPLHAFSPAYFDGRDRKLFSYSEENRAAAEQTGVADGIPLFGDQPLSPPDEQWRHCSLDQLSRFFIHPVRYIMENRLGVHWPSADESLPDRERFDLDPLDRYQLHQQMLKAFQEGLSEEQVYTTARAAGQIPHGTVGRLRHRQQAGEVRQFMRLLEGFVPPDPHRAVPIALDLAPFTVHGILDHIHDSGRVVYRMGRIRPADLLHLHIRHVAMQAAADAALPPTSILIGRDEAWQWGPMPAAAALERLRHCLDLYWQGLQAPLPIYCETSYTYAYERIIKQKPAKAALWAAQGKWQGSQRMSGESADPYLKRACHAANLFTPEFESSALALFEPILSGRSAAQPLN
ncbi:exodeoxyribonuclease V subunit gamma [Desulfatitalea alkaliphila]|uniref:Exodeoxyribonuclease V subunit gamma n=1 Tax=Desulfatitalea alkaliphila TaxID=2929485 RepID=A0AA41R6V0_9BACT|nr:exodeoxyribonuclease V subunit gamma [Desulfatitalea alkaliphila]